MQYGHAKPLLAWCVCPGRGGDRAQARPVFPLRMRALGQVQFSRDGNFLYCGARRDADIFCWDVRYACDVVYRLEREAASTNQRIHFDIEPCGRHLASGASHSVLPACRPVTGAPHWAFRA